MQAKVMSAGRMVAATEHPLSSASAVNVFNRGGNSFDAAAAASLALTVVQPQLNGLGGDFFALLRNGKDHKIYCLNASGWSPTAAGDARRAGRMKKTPTYGSESAVIPGYVAGVFAMQRRFGALDFAECASEAIKLARDGFPIAMGLSRAVRNSARWMSEQARRVYMANGSLPTPGTIIKQPTLAARLSEVAESGESGFYRGPAAKAMQEQVAREGVKWTDDDIAGYKPEWCEAISMNYRDTRVYEVPPNSMGATTLLMLKILEESDIGSLGPNSTERMRLTVQAARQAYAARDLKLGDPRFAEFDLETFLHSGAIPAEQTQIRDGDTTYFSVADDQGNVLSCIQSTFHAFGSRVFVRDGGFFLNNRGSSFKTTGPNALGARKRPLHTLSALILERKGDPFVAVGCSGGDYRPQQHALFVTDIVDYSMNIADTIAYPRFLWDGGKRVIVEDGLRTRRTAGIEWKAYAYPGPTGVAQGIQRSGATLTGVCDIRGDGFPAGV